MFVVAQFLLQIYLIVKANHFFCQNHNGSSLGLKAKLNTRFIMINCKTFSVIKR